jgi:hypothetical protein
VWWCPEIGYSMTEGHHLFATEGEAVAKAIAELEQQAFIANQKLFVLKRRQDELPEMLKP